MHHDHLYARYDMPDLALPLMTQILPGLWQGGTADDDWLDNAVPLRTLDDDRPFDAVLTLFAWARPCGWNVAELRYGFADAGLETGDVADLVDAASWAHRRWSAGQRVLIRCQAGLNRSGLLTAMVMMLDGWDAAGAVGHIRARRGPQALFNTRFVDWLIDEAAPAILPAADVA